MPRLVLLPAAALLIATLGVGARPALALMPPRQGPLPVEVQTALNAGRFRLATPPRLGTSVVRPVWKIPILLVDFPDQPLVFSSPADWEHALFDTTGSTATGSVFDYYQWVSGNRIRVIGKVVASIRLSQPKSFYTNNSWGLSSSTPQNAYGVVDEALRLSGPSVDWSEFDQDRDGYVDMLWVVHAGLGGEHVVTRQDLWSITSRLSDWSNGSPFRTQDPVPGGGTFEHVNAFSILPELSAFRPGLRSEIGVYCHEFGHALGLPDLYDTAPFDGRVNYGPGNWSLMSTGVYGGDGNSPEYPTHMGAWANSYLGWTARVRPTQDGSISLGPIERGAPVLELWFQGESNYEHFLVEYRRREGFDRNLPADGLVVYAANDLTIRSGIPGNRVNFGLYPGLRLVEADGGASLMEGISRGDAYDPMPGLTGLAHWTGSTSPHSRSARGSLTHVALHDIQLTADSARAQLRVHMPGWAPEREPLEPHAPLVGGGLGARAVLLSDSSIAFVSSELGAGGAQVRLRIRHPDGHWDPAEVVSQSSAVATDPAISRLPGDDLAVTWSDTRYGANELFYRARIRGAWTPEQRLTDLSGFSRYPAMASDERGGIHLAWQYSDGGVVSTYFLYFPYVSPFGDPRRLSAPEARPDPPLVVATTAGTSYVLWPDRVTGAAGVWFSRFSPDSGVRPPLRLTTGMTGTLATIAADIDQNGQLHYAWQVSRPAGVEIHYQVRGGSLSPDTALVVRGEAVQHIDLRLTPDGGRHLVLEATSGTGTQILYKAWRPDGDWDVGSTTVTSRSEQTVTRPLLIPRRHDAVTVLFTRFGGQGATLVERERNPVAQSVTGLGATTWTPEVPQITARPNPLRAGAGLWLGAPSASPGSRMLVHDVAGRLVASAPVTRGTSGPGATFPSRDTARWASGVYFARVAGNRSVTRFVVVR